MKLQNPKPKFIHESSDETTQETSVANLLTPVATMQVPEGRVWVLQSGLVLNGHFKSAGDSFGDDGDKIVLAYKKPGDSIWKPIEGAEQVMGGFNNTTKELQQSKENDDGRRFQILSGHIAFNPKDTIGILVESAVVKSWTYSHFKLPVTEMAKR